MTINNKLYKFVVAYFMGVGGFTVILTLLNATIGVSKFEQSLCAAIVSFIPVAAISVLILRSGLDNFELWARRIITALLNMTCITLFFAIFGVLESAVKIAISFSAGIAGNLLVSIPLYIILDRRNKRKLEAINKKLKENSNNSETF